ncbi:hypothetical protein DNTS_000101 [Danionella cerebrum]|uniref:Uncharacterized protein n=1 Tax=Danionella cerebrum TaxID=2873325 RepID=A0A553QCQ3_9TELE|nr:hypothetical protein DNTS_000101 [Danionella translucida]
MIKAASRVKQSHGEAPEECLDSDSAAVQDEPVYLPDETLEEMSRSTTQQLHNTEEEVIAGPKEPKILQTESEVTQGSRRSTGGASAISPKSTDPPALTHSRRALSPGGPAGFQTALPDKRPSKNAATKDEEKQSPEKVKKSKRLDKQMSKSKRNLLKPHEEAETLNTSIPDAATITKKKKTKMGKERKAEESESTNAQEPLAKVKQKKKSHPSFVVGQAKQHQAEGMEPHDPETEMSREREAKTLIEDDQEHSYVNSEDDISENTDSESTDFHAYTPRSVFSTQRSQYSLITVRSESTLKRVSQASVRSSSKGATCSSASLSLIHLPPLPGQPPPSDRNLTKPEPDHNQSQPVNNAEHRRLKVERKRMEKEEEKKRQQEKEETEERMRLELKEEQKKRAEEARIQMIKEEQERKRREEDEMEKQRKEQAEKERERRRQEEKKRLLERLQKERLEEEKRRTAEVERQRLQKEAQREEECRKLSEMQETDRLEYLLRQQEEEEQRKRAAEERRRKEEEAAELAEKQARFQAQLLARQREALERHLRFHRGLFEEAGGLEQSQDVSRPWLFSYFTLLKLLGLTE